MKENQNQSVERRKIKTNRVALRQRNHKNKQMKTENIWKHLNYLIEGERKTI